MGWEHTEAAVFIKYHITTNLEILLVRIPYNYASRFIRVTNHNAYTGSNLGSTNTLRHRQNEQVAYRTKSANMANVRFDIPHELVWCVVWSVAAIPVIQQMSSC